MKIYLNFLKLYIVNRRLFFSEHGVYLRAVTGRASNRCDRPLYLMTAMILRTHATESAQINNVCSQSFDCRKVHNCLHCSESRYCQISSKNDRFLQGVFYTLREINTPNFNIPASYPDIPSITHRGCWMLLLQYFREVWILVITTPLRQTLEAYPGLTPVPELDIPS